MEIGDDTQDAAMEEENTTRIRDWIGSRLVDTVDLADILTNFPDISVALTKEIIDKLLKEGLLTKSGRDSYLINREKGMDCDATVVKEEFDMQVNLHAEKVHKNNNNDYMYMKALYHALPMDYVTISKL